MLRSNGPGSICTPSMSLTMILMSVGRMVYHALRELVFSEKNEFLNKSGSVPTSYSKQEGEVDIHLQSSFQDPNGSQKLRDIRCMEGAGGNYI